MTYFSTTLTQFDFQEKNGLRPHLIISTSNETKKNQNGKEITTTRYYCVPLTKLYDQNNVKKNIQKTDLEFGISSGCSDDSLVQFNHITTFRKLNV
jgi:hypothetical protein